MSINTFIWMGKMYRQILLLAAFTCIGQTFAQCTKDIDCKGDRVCVNGKCQESLKQKPPCTRDVDCQGDSLCDHGRCIAEDNKSPRINTSPALTHGNETLSSIAKVESNSQGINKSPEINTLQYQLKLLRRIKKLSMSQLGLFPLMEARI